MALRSPLTVQPYDYISDSTGRPLDKGQIYIGVAGQDPEFYQIPVYLDAAMTKPIDQPIRTNDGFVDFAGGLTELYASEEIYSLKVLDKQGRKVIYKAQMMRDNLTDDALQSLDAAIAESQEQAVIATTSLVTEAIDNVMLGEYQTQLEEKVDAQKLDTGITATAKFGGVSRMQSDVNAETLSVEDFGASTSNTDNTTQINNAIAYCKGSGARLVFPYEYAVTGNLVDLHDIKTSGAGSITRNGKKWHITPQDTQKNTLYAAPDGSVDNDGLDPAFPKNLKSVNTTIQHSIGSKSGNGVWGLEMAIGTYTGEGLRLYSWPIFKEKFQWHGADNTATKNKAPTVIWDGVSAVVNQDAVLSQNFSSYLNIDFKYIYFKNWSRRGLCLWNVGDYTFSHCWFENGAVGLSYRYSFGTIKNCRFVGLTSEGMAIGYQATAMNGSLSAEDGNIFIGCGTGADIGRNSTMYAQKNVFTNCGRDIICSRMSRLRPQGNTHNGWLAEAYRLENGGVLTPDNGQGNPDVFNNTNNKPILTSSAGGWHPDAHRFSQAVVNNYSNKTETLAAGTDLTHLSTYFSNENFVPFRLPSWTLLSPSVKLKLEINAYLDTSSSGELVLCGQGGAGGAAEIARVNIPSIAFANRGVYRIEFETINKGDGKIETFITIPRLNFMSLSAKTITSFMAASVDSNLTFRLYGSNTGTGDMSFYSLRSYVEL